MIPPPLGGPVLASGTSFGSIFSSPAQMSSGLYVSIYNSGVSLRISDNISSVSEEFVGQVQHGTANTVTHGLKHSAGTYAVFGGLYETSLDASTWLEVDPQTPGVRAKLMSQLTVPDILDDAVTIEKSADGKAATGTFTPRYGLTLDEAAALINEKNSMQIDHFNWVQWVTYDDDPNRPTVNK